MTQSSRTARWSLIGLMFAGGSAALSTVGVRTRAAEVGGASPAAQGRAITYTRDIAPILNTSCVECHRAGEAGPFTLTSYADAKRRAGLIARVTSSRQMPPWKAQADYGHFLGERHLTDAQITALSGWVAAGTPEGDPADLPPSPTFPSDGQWPLGKPDRVVTLPAAYHVKGDGPDVFRNFVIPLHLSADQYVTAAEFRASDRAVVHHALLFLDTRGQARARDALSHKQHPNDAEPGYSTFGDPGFVPSGTLGGWAPGAKPSFLPPGVARSLPAKADLIVQVHFHPTGKPEVEQSQVAIYFAKQKPERLMIPVVLGNHDIDIPAGDKDYVVTDDYTLPADVSVVGITPHAHLLCRQMQAWATLPVAAAPTTKPASTGMFGSLATAVRSIGGSSAPTPTPMPAANDVPLIKIMDWDFNWQGQYRYAEPVHLPKGATLHMRYAYDNSAANERNPNVPPQRVTFGEETHNEMAFCFLEVTPDHPTDLGLIRRDMFMHLIKIR